jgi:hypothetical protein
MVKHQIVLSDAERAIRYQKLNEELDRLAEFRRKARAALVAAGLI